MAFRPSSRLSLSKPSSPLSNGALGSPATLNLDPEAGGLVHSECLDFRTQRPPDPGSPLGGSLNMGVRNNAVSPLASPSGSFTKSSPTTLDKRQSVAQMAKQVHVSKTADEALFQMFSKLGDPKSKAPGVVNEDAGPNHNITHAESAPLTLYQLRKEGRNRTGTAGGFGSDLSFTEQSQNTNQDLLAIRDYFDSPLAFENEGTVEPSRRESRKSLATQVKGVGQDQLDIDEVLNLSLGLGPPPEKNIGCTSQSSNHTPKDRSGSPSPRPEPSPRRHTVADPADSKWSQLRNRLDAIKVDEGEVAKVQQLLESNVDRFEDTLKQARRNRRHTDHVSRSPDTSPAGTRGAVPRFQGRLRTSQTRALSQGTNGLSPDPEQSSPQMPGTLAPGSTASGENESHGEAPASPYVMVQAPSFDLDGDPAEIRPAENQLSPGDKRGGRRRVSEAPGKARTRSPRRSPRRDTVLLEGGSRRRDSQSPQQGTVQQNGSARRCSAQLQDQGKDRVSRRGSRGSVDRSGIPTQNRGSGRHSPTRSGSPGRQSPTRSGSPGRQSRSGSPGRRSPTQTGSPGRRSPTRSPLQPLENQGRRSSNSRRSSASNRRQSCNSRPSSASNGRQSSGSRPSSASSHRPASKSGANGRQSSGSRPSSASSHRPASKSGAPKLQPAGKRQGGGFESYTAEGIQERSKIFHSGEFRALLLSIWNGLSLQDGKLNRRGYKMLYRKLYWQVVPEGTKKECDELAEVEWRAESKGRDALNFEEFYESMFLFVDVWCDGLSEPQYLQFATELLQPILKQQWVTPSQQFDLSTSISSQAFPSQAAPGEPGAPPRLMEEEMVDAQARVSSMSANPPPPLDIYRDGCLRCALPVSVDVCAALRDAPRQGMKELVVPHAGLTSILPFLDLLLLHRDLERVELQGNRLDCSSFELLLKVLLLHPKLWVLNISENPCMSSRIVAVMYQLLCRNTQLRRVQFQNTVPMCYDARIKKQLDFNFHSQVISRREYHQLKKAFQGLDALGEKCIDLYDLVNWFSVEHLRGRKAAASANMSPTAKEGSSRIQYRALKAWDRAKADFEATGIIADFTFKCTFPDLLQMLYPSIPSHVVERYIDYFDTEQDPMKRKHLSNAQIRSIFVSYDLNGDGYLTSEELKIGLESEGLSEAWELYSGDIARFDLNRDGVLSADEFLLWMSLVDNCTGLVDGTQDGFNASTDSKANEQMQSNEPRGSASGVSGKSASQQQPGEDQHEG